IDVAAWLGSIARLRALRPGALYLTHWGRVEDVPAHLDQLEAHLHAWVEWMRGPFERGTPPEEITPAFTRFAEDQLRAAGVADAATLARYEAANPAWMSVAGLLRYWRKRTEA
ncbi:MAG: MBL fold metallo-hydrolase, partial [Catalinimonas sp.]